MDTKEFDEERYRRYVEFVIDHGKRHHLLTRSDQTGVKKRQKKFNMKRLQTKFKKLKIKAGCSGVTKDKMILDEGSYFELEVEKQLKTEMDTEIDQPLPMPERKDKMVLDESSGLELEKRSKTKMDTKIDQPLPMPERKDCLIFLDATHTGGSGEAFLESQAWLSYQTEFFEKVFGSRASEMISESEMMSLPLGYMFEALLTDEEFKLLEGMDGVDVEEPPRYEYFGFLTR